MIPNRCASDFRSGCGYLLVGLCLAASINITSQTQIQEIQAESFNNESQQFEEGPALQTSDSNLENKINTFYSSGRVSRGEGDVYRGPYFGTRGKKYDSNRLPFYWGSNQHVWGKVPYKSKSNIISESEKPNAISEGDVLSSPNEIRIKEFDYGQPEKPSPWGSNQYIWGRRKRNGDEGPFWASRGKRPEDEEPFWISRGKRDIPESENWGSNQPPYSNYLEDLNFLLSSLGNKRSVQSDIFWATRDQIDSNTIPFTAVRGKRNKQNLSLIRGRKDENKAFWLARGRKDDTSQPFWLARGKKEDGSQPFWLARGKKEDGSQPFWLARGKKEDGNQPFWLARGKKEDGNQPFWMARGKKEDGNQPFWMARGKKELNQPFWMARGKREDEIQPFWMARGKKDGNQPFWMARGKKEDENQPFWLARGKKEDGPQPFWLARGKKEDGTQPFWLARGKKDQKQPFWLARGKKDEEIKPFWVSRGKKDARDKTVKSRYILNIPGKKEDKSNIPFWVVRGRRTPSINSNSHLNEEDELIIYLLHLLIREQDNISNITPSLRNKKYGILPTTEPHSESNLMTNFMPVRG